METWQTHHENIAHPEWAVTVTWRWSQRTQTGAMLPRGMYRAKPIALEFTVFVPQETQEEITAWLKESETRL